MDPMLANDPIGSSEKACKTFFCSSTCSSSGVLGRGVQDTQNQFKKIQTDSRKQKPIVGNNNATRYRVQSDGLDFSIWFSCFGD